MPAAPESLPFENTAVTHVFRVRYEGEPRPLRDFLADRYRYWLKPARLAGAYPGRVRLNGRPVGAETVARPGDEIAYLHHRADEPLELEPPRVLYADEWMVVLYKPDSVPVTPSGPYYFSSVTVRAREVFANPELTPIHRLDQETDGPLVMARRNADLKRFHRLFQRQRIDKTYRALAHGRVPPDLRRIAGRIVPAEGSRIHTRLRLEPDAAATASVTEIRRVVHHDTPRGAFSELEVVPLTGKTNQIRVHLAHHGHPIVGDKKYHPDEEVFLDWLAHKDFARVAASLLLPRQALQCAALRFPHPFTEAPMTLEAPPGAWRRKLAPLLEAALDAEPA